VKERRKGLNWALKPSLLLRDVPRRPGWLSACARVCVVLAPLHWVCGFTPAGARAAGVVPVQACKAEQILASAFKWFEMRPFEVFALALDFAPEREDFLVKLYYNACALLQCGGGGGRLPCLLLTSIVNKEPEAPSSLN